MASDFLIFGDLQGKLDMLRDLTRWVSDLKGDCPKRDVHALHERCDLICPDLPKVL